MFRVGYCKFNSKFLYVNNCEYGVKFPGKLLRYDSVGSVVIETKHRLYRVCISRIINTAECFVKRNSVV